MPMPTDVPVIDLMLAVPNDDTSNFYDFIRPLLMDEQSRQMFQMPAQYMFKDLPKVGKRDDYIAYTLEKMDEFNIEKAMLGVDEGQYETQCEAVKSIRTAFSRPTTVIPIMVWMRSARFAASKKSMTSSRLTPFRRVYALRCRCPIRSGTRSSLPALTWIFRFVHALACPDPEFPWSHRKSSTLTKFAGSSRS